MAGPRKSSGLPQTAGGDAIEDGFAADGVVAEGLRVIGADVAGGYALTLTPLDAIRWPALLTRPGKGAFAGGINPGH